MGGEGDLDRAKLDRIASLVAGLRHKPGTFVVGVTGSVASGKSDIAAALVPAMAADGEVVELVSTDGFLLPNAVLDSRGLTLRKGFPESYDLDALARALTAVRAGPAAFPAYSHATYDPDLDGARVLERPDLLLIEGLALGLDRPLAAGAASLVDCLIFVDAEEADLEAWFTGRFLALWDAAGDDPASFYSRFRNLDRAGAMDLARQVWGGINLPNLREHIAPVRAHADIIVRMGPDHTIRAIDPGGPGA